MDEPVYTNAFISKVIAERKDDIIGLATSKGNRIKAKGKRVNFAYAVTLLIIMGIIGSFKVSLLIIDFKIRCRFSRFFLYIRSPSIIQTAKEAGIPAWEIESVNNEAFIQELKSLKPDIIINQAQEILSEKFISIPLKGVLNRHASLLPRNRGRLTPFWVLLNQEKETGVSIHFVTAEVDQGDIIAQSRFPVDNNDNFLSLAQKGYDVAADLMLQSLDEIEREVNILIYNDPDKANYHSTPTLKDAMKYQLIMLKKTIKRGVNHIMT
ncbi:MAG: hypothetical protein APR63_01575 [Desulfuromonas sp. SDB]|nr:MAG: hypothetical protein APR63_01575 [Desulfuromonas sp. SDB]